MGQLNQAWVNSQVLPESLSKLDGDAASLPERVLQFGTGVLLRGLPLYFIEKANQRNVFNGRVIVVKSTSHGGTVEFDKQDNLYTLHIQGVEDGKEVKEAMLVSAISRVLSAATQWREVVRTAEDPNVEIVISNTTEVGIVLDETDSLKAEPPVSFPGKLTALLYQRFRHFDGDTNKGWTILPTELISDNGRKLKDIVMSLARKNGLGDDFLHWVEVANDFCTTLVDRIVPGKLPQAEAAEHERLYGYQDSLAIMAEPFRLWAVEPATDRIRKRLSFSQTDPGMVLVDDITKFKELKLRLLNGTHTFSCALALLCGFDTVKSAMRDAHFGRYVHDLMNQEIVPAIVGPVITEQEAKAFASSVIDRFSNPFLEHRWLSISVHYTSKMRMRNVALLREFQLRQGAVPDHMALGFAAYLKFMECRPTADGRYEGQIGELAYTIEDDQAPYFAEVWANHTAPDVVRTVLANVSLWGYDLTALEGFADLVNTYLDQLSEGKAVETLRTLNRNEI